MNFAVTAKLISAFVFAARIVQLHFYLNPKFQASSSFLCLYRPVCVGPVRKPHCWFSHEEAHLITKFAIHIRACPAGIVVQVEPSRHISLSGLLGWFYECHAILSLDKKSHTRGPMVL